MFLKRSVRFCFVYFLKSKWRRVETETCIYIYTCITYRKLRKGLCIQNFGHFFQQLKEKVMDLLTLIKKKSSPLKKLEIAIEENNIKELKEVLESGEVDPNTEIQKHGGNCAGTVLYTLPRIKAYFSVQKLCWSMVQTLTKPTIST